MAGTFEDAKAWRQKAAALQAKHAQISALSSQDLILALSELWRLVFEPTRDLAVSFRDLDETELSKASAFYHDLLHDGHIAWQASGTWRQTALAVAGQLRALDAELATRPRFAQPPASSSQLLCRETDIFVIPRARPKPGGRRPGPGNGLLRRATPHHRLIPRVIDGKFEVELHWTQHFAFGSVPRDEGRVGAALFPGLAVKWDEREDGHVAVEAPCSDEATALAAQLDGAFADGFLAVAWPELSMPPDRLDRLKGGLAARAAKAPALVGPVLVAAGSWHEEEDGVVRNVMRLLDKTGRERLRFDKITTFVGGGVREGNLAAARIPVLLNNDALITFAVCSDFCDLDLDPPYLQMDVDLIVVPSLGNANALKGHEGNAQRMAVRTGASTFVVQQHESKKEPLGWVFPKRDGAPSLEEQEAWSTRSIAFR